MRTGQTCVFSCFLIFGIPRTDPPSALSCRVSFSSPHRFRVHVPSSLNFIRRPAVQRYCTKNFNMCGQFGEVSNESKRKPSVPKGGLAIITQVGQVFSEGCRKDGSGRGSAHERATTQKVSALSPQVDVRMVFYHTEPNGLCSRVDNV